MQLTDAEPGSGQCCDLSAGTVGPLFPHKDAVVGETLVLAGCVFMFLGGIIMGVADALGFWPRKGDSVRGDIGASLLPLVALVAAAI
ncbi:MAG TPA: hypothetical protein VFP81_12000 [Propionibacteriaceae bacterium]|nr:hypothetical protein [Propionibacteriaceae bacterium]